MIDQSDIEQKDFSISLPMTIRKVKAISSLLISVKENEAPFVTGQELQALGDILGEIVDDLNVIRTGIYG